LHNSWKNYVHVEVVNCCTKDCCCR